MLRFKQKVKLNGIKPEMAPVFTIASEAYKELYNADCWVTSVCDGKHSDDSKHYVGYALDLRIRNLIDLKKFRRAGFNSPELVEKARKLADSMQNYLGDNFDVVLERTHIHIEYDPRK